jgi:hypothetical protein
MGSPETFWLTLTNIVLGVAVVLCLLIMALGVCCKALAKLKKDRSYDAELNRDMEEMFGSSRSSVAALHTEAHRNWLK